MHDAEGCVGLPQDETSRLHTCAGHRICAGRGFHARHHGSPISLCTRYRAHKQVCITDVTECWLKGVQDKGLQLVVEPSVPLVVPSTPANRSRAHKQGRIDMTDLGLTNRGASI